MAQTLSEIRQMLDSAGLRPQKAFGQNFLIDHNLLGEIVRFADLPTGAAVLEIGPGTGTLTDELLAAGAKVLAVEIDRGLASVLEDRYAGNEKFRLINCDVMSGKHSIADDVIRAAAEHAKTAPDGKLHLVSNLPYNITTPIVCEFLVLSYKNCCGSGGLPLADITATVQAEAADRISATMAKAGDYGPAAILIATLANTILGKILPPQAFWPQPKVTSRMIRLEFAPKEFAPVDMEKFTAVLAASFSQRRKKILSACNGRNALVNKEIWKKSLIDADIDPDLRPEQISPEQFARFSDLLDL